VSGYGLLHRDLSEKERADQDHLMRILQRHKLTALNTWSRKSNAATYVHAKGGSQIDFVCSRKSVADGEAKRARPVDTYMAGWRVTGHKPVIASIPHRWTPWKQPKRQDNNVLKDLGDNAPLLRYCQENQPCNVTQLREAVQRAGGIAPMKAKKPELAPVDDSISGCWKLRRKLHIAQTAHRNLKKALRARKRQRTLELLSQAEKAASKNDVRGLYGIVNLLCPNKNALRIRLRDKDGNLMCGADECRELAQYARELFMAPEYPKLQLLPIAAEEMCIERWLRAARKLQAEKAAPNNSPPLRNWKQHSEPVVTILQKLASGSLCCEEPVIPTEWTEVQLAWLAKPRKSPSTPANLRTVGLMAGDTKMFMMVLKEAISERVMQGLWDIPQFAYRKFSSTIDALLRGSLHCEQ
ncbi:unnamed protein product, partial [Symbiodinium sp. CCMP2456]